MKGLAGLLKEKAEREARKAERERIKKEKEELKKKEAKEKQREKRRLKAYNTKIKRKRERRHAARAQVLKERELSGDEKAFHTIFVTRNNKRIQRLGASWWKNDALKLYHGLIEKNRREVEFPVEILTSHTGKSRKDNQKTACYEILLVKKIPDGYETVSQFRDEYGKYQNNIIVGKGKESHIIVEKEEWFVEETFNVYGYHPKRDRKTYRFIYNNLVTNNISCREDVKRIIRFYNKLIIEQGSEFDFVICKNADECRRLCNKIFSDIEKSGNKLVVYGGEAKNTMTTYWADRIVEKTGWLRSAVLKHTLI